MTLREFDTQRAMTGKSNLTEMPAARPYGGVSAEARRQQRRERLIEAGIEVLGTRGLAQSTIRDICTEARLTDRYFYESFRSVQEVFEAVYVELSTQLVDRLAAAMMPMPRNMQAMAEAGLRAFFSFVREDPRRARILLIDAMGLYFSAPEDTTIRMDSYVGLLKGLYETLYPQVAQAADTFDIVFVAKNLVGMTSHAGAIWSQDGFDKSIEEMVRHCLFAWLGLDAWLKAVTQPAAATAPAGQASSVSKS